MWWFWFDVRLRGWFGLVGVVVGWCGFVLVVGFCCLCAVVDSVAGYILTCGLGGFLGAFGCGWVGFWYAGVLRYWHGVVVFLWFCV